MNDEIVEQFNNQNLKQGSVILKVIYYNPPDLKIQHLTVKEKVKIYEVIECEMDILSLL